MAFVRALPLRTHGAPVATLCLGRRRWSPALLRPPRRAAVVMDAAAPADFAEAPRADLTAPALDHLWCPPPAFSKVVSLGDVHDCAYPWLLDDGGFHGFAGEWGFFGAMDVRGVSLTAPAAALSRDRAGGGARTWARQPGASSMTQINLHEPHAVTRGAPATPRHVDGLRQMRWMWDCEAGRPEPAVVPGPGGGGVLFTDTGGGVWGIISGPAPIGTLTKTLTAPGSSMVELFLRGMKRCWSVVFGWEAAGAAVTLRALIRESPVTGWGDVEATPITLPSLAPASPPTPVADWVSGRPGPDVATAGVGVAKVLALVPPPPEVGAGGGGNGGGGDGGGRHMRAWDVAGGVRWAPAGGGRDGGATRHVALEDGLYLSMMADPHDGGVVEFGSVDPPGGQARQRLLVVIEPGSIVSRVIHETYPPVGGKA